MFAVHVSVWSFRYIIGRDFWNDKLKGFFTWSELKDASSGKKYNQHICQCLCCHIIKFASLKRPNILVRVIKLAWWIQAGDVNFAAKLVPNSHSACCALQMRKGVLVKSVGVVDACADTVFEVLLNLERQRRYE